MSDHQDGQQNPQDAADSQEGMPNQPSPNNMPPPGDEGDQPGPRQDRPPPRAYPDFQPPPRARGKYRKQESSVFDDYDKGCGIILLIAVAIIAFAVVSCFGSIGLPLYSLAKSFI